MNIKKTLTRRAFGIAGAVVAARGGISHSTNVRAQEPTPTPGPYTTPEPPPESVPVPTELPVQDSYTFLVGGTDTRGIGYHENTDVMMISRVEIANRRVRTLSIPRDLYGEIPGHDSGKINGAFNIASMAGNYDWNAAATLFRETIEWNFNLKIDGVVTTSLLKMPGVVDALGGITVDNPYSFRDENYPTDDFGLMEVYFPEGEIRLNGEESLQYSRSRKADSDEARVLRQQAVLAACLTELQKPELISRIPDVYEAGKAFVTTDIPADVQGQLIASVPDIDPELVAWGTIIDHVQGQHFDDGSWNYLADWNYLGVHVRGWLGVGKLDPNRP